MTNDALLQRCRRVVSQLEGRLRIEGLQRPVEVIRDQWGVPHIYAENQHDLFFAQGFVAAQDRLFQMDWWRRVGVGETAEVLGPSAVPADRFARLIRYRGDLEAEWRSYGPGAREIATAFTCGINACIDAVGDRLPIEFQVLEYRPKKWRPEDILGRMSGIIMARNFQYELQRARLIAEVGVEKARRLAPTDPPLDYAPAAGIDVRGIDPEEILAAYKAASETLPFQRETRGGPRVGDGSNNWVIPGSRSQSGKPLLASDPHRTIALPSLRYLVHLHAPGWNVIGSGEPALPGVAIGHNERIAWGFTIVGTDQADFYVEELHPEDAARYRVGDEWQPLEIVREELSVRGQAEPVEIELQFTRHGPVVHVDVERRRAFALKWAGAEPGAAAYLGALLVNRAVDWESFLQALAGWKMPSENMVYADVEGNVGWVAAALTPVRENSTGLLPVPGADGKHEWVHFLDVCDLPQRFNPPEPIATANHNILPEGYQHTIAYEWAAGFRYDRIQELLGSRDKFDLHDMKLMQHDSLSIPGRRLAKLAGQFALEDSKLEGYRRQFAAWDGRLSRDARWGPLYGCWLKQLSQAVFGAETAGEALKYVGGQRGVPTLLEALSAPTAEWFGADAVAGRDAVLRRTFAAAVRDVEDALGADPAGWRWDRLHTVTFQHPLSNLAPEYAAAFDRGPFGQAGDGLCPNATRYEDGFHQVSGASYRHIFDLSDWDKGLATSAPGQSGQPESPHYDDLLTLWREEQYFPLVFSREAVERHARHRLRLEPA